MVDAQGNVVQTYEYDAFGKPDHASATEPWNRFMFTGREYDHEIGLYYYRNRYYHPELGRFLQEDPLGYIAGINQLTYVNNCPTLYIDPLGLWTAQIGGYAMGGYFGAGGMIFAGYALSYSSTYGFQHGFFVSAGAGGYAGLGGSAGLQISVSGNQQIGDLSGAGASVGASGGEGLCIGGEGDFVSGGEMGVSGNIGVGGGVVPGEMHGLVTNTKVKQIGGK